MIQHDKLIRDRIPELIAASGRSCKTRVLDAGEFEERLRRKLQEEVDEFMGSPCIEELADILEVLEALARTLGSNLSEVEAIRAKKRDERGGFEERLFLEYVE